MKALVWALFIPVKFLTDHALPQDIRIRNRYRIGHKIADSGISMVYSGTDLHTGDEVAIKLQSLRNPWRLENEADMYSELQGSQGIPHIHWRGEEADFYVLVMDALGPSLEDLFNFCDRRFSLKTVLLLADQLLHRVEYIHSKQLLHCDIKPENLLMGAGKHGSLVHVVDFDLAEHYWGHGHIEYREGCGFAGTSRYASLNTHLGITQSRRDDLESLGYVLIYFAHGCLPWQGLGHVTKEDNRERIKEKKVGTSVEELCRGLPEEFTMYLKYTRSLGFEDQPNYGYLRKIFRDLFVREGYQYDNVFDWTIKRFFMLRDGVGQSDSASKP